MKTRLTKLKMDNGTPRPQVLWRGKTASAPSPFSCETRLRFAVESWMQAYHFEALAAGGGVTGIRSPSMNRGNISNAAAVRKSSMSSVSANEDLREQ